MEQTGVGRGREGGREGVGGRGWARVGLLLSLLMLMMALLVSPALLLMMVMALQRVSPALLLLAMRLPCAPSCGAQQHYRCPTPCKDCNLPSQTKLPHARTPTHLASPPH